MQQNQSKQFLQKMAAVFRPTLFVGFGIVLPLIALGIEMATDMCAESMHYDPIPTIPHMIVVGLVPLVLLFWAIARNNGQTAANPGWRIALGLVAGISLSYAIPFAPIVPFSLILVLVGIGFLPLAPFGSFFVAAYSMYRTNKEAGSTGWWGSAGLVAGLLLVTALAFPQFVIERTIDTALNDFSEDAETRAAAISTLRDLDPDKVETFLCDYRRAQWPNPANFVTSEMIDFRRYENTYPELYWRVTGNACPSELWSRDVRFVPGRDDEPGLEIASSRFDGSVSANSGIAYTEWLYEVKNNDTRIREADMVVQLPAEGVVSRVTLWVHNEPKEATFAGRAKAQGAYEAVVSRSRDPILVTEESPGRIRVRMFPVNPGAVMKARIGVTHPLQVNGDGVEMKLPQIVGGNVAHDTEHDVWIESKQKITSVNAALREIERQDDYQVRGLLPDSKIGTTSIRTTFPKPVVHVPFEEGVIEQRFDKINVPAPEHLTLVIDGSGTMAKQKEAIATALGRLQNSTFVTLIFSADVEPLVRYERIALTDDNRSRLIDAVRTFDYAGGRDNVPALRAAQQRAVEENARIVWIHAAQKVSFGGLLTVEGRDAVRFDTYQVDGGRDVLSDAMHANGSLRAIPRNGIVERDLSAFFGGLSGDHFAYTRTRRERSDPSSVETSNHLMRLWAYDNVNHILQNGTREEAIVAAANAQIVTAASAAIVLETAEQYERFGLDQASGTGVPTIPEPEEWALIIVATMALCFAAWRRRREEQEFAI